MISIIIATYNAGAFLKKSLESISKELVAEDELILIDGGSSDDTVEIIKNYSSTITHWISERDSGIYDAWNKGLKYATGKWIMFLGADDELLKGSLKKYKDFISNLENANQLHFISSRVKMVDIHGKDIRIKGWEWQWPKFQYEMTVAHPGALHSSLLFAEYGNFDTDYKITGDYELLLRPKNNLRCAFMNDVTVQMAEGGMSDSIKALKEHLRAAINTGGLSRVRATKNYAFVYTKFKTKKIFRMFNVNVYLKK